MNIRIEYKKSPSSEIVYTEREVVVQNVECALEFAHLRVSWRSKKLWTKKERRHIWAHVFIDGKHYCDFHC